MGAIGSAITLTGGAYTLISGINWAEAEIFPITRVFLALGLILTSFGFLGIFRETGSYIPIIPFIFFNLYQIIGTLLSPFLHLGYFTPAYLVTWSIMFIAYGFAGYSFQMTHDRIGGIATTAAILTVIWAFLRIAAAYETVVTDDLLFHHLRAIGESIVMASVLIYFIIAMRIRK
ncbi:MAG: hypothetical protein ACFFER_14365 [Candidatus Thorarchaeota archaeon]